MQFYLVKHLKSRFTAKKFFLDCIWYGTTFCDGDVVEDLYRWWFKMKCSKTKFSVDSSSWAEVIKRKQQEQMKDVK